MTDDLSAVLARLRAGQTSAAAEIERSLAAAGAPPCRHAFVRMYADAARAAARAADAAAARGAALPLAGLAISVKDNFDMVEHAATAGSVALADARAESGGAGQAPVGDAAAVARLRAAGAALVGHTNMTEFAYSGLGLNPHHGTPRNPATAALDGVERIPGGSSSGAAVSVAAGAAWAGLGSDTGGSIRIPAALHGLVGFKSTQALVPRAGLLPLADSLDTAGAITRSVRDAVLLHEILAARAVTLAAKPLAARRLGVPRGLPLDGVDAAVARAFAAALERLSRAGAEIVEFELAPLAALPTGGIVVSAEAWSWYRHLSGAQQARVDPRVARRVVAGRDVLAADYIERRAEQRAWVAAMEQAMAGFDALLSPTVPVVAPELAPLQADDAAYFAANGLLLRNPSLVNALGGCAVSLPCQARGELPVGLMLWSRGGQDDDLLDTALRIEQVL
ncbi:MAG: amidase [Pelomonas sp.]|nr:amidase [Roseateles sp.]